MTRLVQRSYPTTHAPGAPVWASVGLALVIGLVAAQVRAESCQAPQWLAERFVSADCGACWQAVPPAVTASGATARSKGEELVLDWVLPGRQGADAPLALAALPEARPRAARDGEPSFDETTVRREPIRAQRTLQLTVEDGPAWNGYIGVRLAVEWLGGRAVPAGSAGWLALVEEIPAGEDGSPVDRRLVRVLAGPLSLEGLRIGHPIEHLRAVRVPDTTRPERLRAVGWVESADGRTLAAQRRPDLECNGPAQPASGASRKS